MTALEASIIEYDPDVIGITESWTTLTENHLQSELEEYPYYRKDRRMCERSKCGGVLLYMKIYFLHREKNDITVNNSTEALWCEVKIDGRKYKVVIGICYDSPTNNEDQSNMLYNDICTAAKSDLIIMETGFPQSWKIMEKKAVIESHGKVMETEENK